MSKLVPLAPLASLAEPPRSAVSSAVVGSLVGLLDDDEEEDGSDAGS